MTLDAENIISGTTTLWIVSLILLVGLGGKMTQAQVGVGVGSHIGACYLLLQGHILIPMFCWIAVAGVLLMAADRHPLRRHER
ncbi:hypothetical protein [Nevskia ramosa]|uniref:hypothetical protein n=1 Tax=Nevskia ramosa TaxID=64002 RepID=UPI00235498B1|nr:hypothetical protein [Nevskia ramosa]